MPEGCCWGFWVEPAVSGRAAAESEGKLWASGEAKGEAALLAWLAEVSRPPSDACKHRQASYTASSCGWRCRCRE